MRSFGSSGEPMITMAIIFPGGFAAGQNTYDITNHKMGACRVASSEASLWNISGGLNTKSAAVACL